MARMTHLRHGQPAFDCDAPAFIQKVFQFPLRDKLRSPSMEGLHDNHHRKTALHRPCRRQRGNMAAGSAGAAGENAGDRISRLRLRRAGRRSPPLIPPGLAEAGMIEGRDATIEYRWAEFHTERLPKLAGELVNRGINVLAAPG